MTRHLSRLGPIVEHDIGDDDAGALNDDVALAIYHANRSAVDRAHARLQARVPSRALEVLAAYFPEPEAVPWSVTNQRPAIDDEELMAEICSRPRSVAIDNKAVGLQLEVRTLGENVDRVDLGEPIEPDSDVVLPLPDRVRRLVNANGSVELRQFDRQCPSWASFADDIATVSGADVYCKAFIAGGNQSVNGWHRDGSDVLVTLAFGSKRFEVASTESDDRAPDIVVGADLNPGDAVLLPRGRLHCATPMTNVSCLVSIGLMRAPDWSYRQVPPTHMGYRSFPRSSQAYRLCLRPHTPPTHTSAGMTHRPTYHARMPGGLRLLRSPQQRRHHVAASGYVWDLSEIALHALLVIHAGGGVDQEVVTSRIPGNAQELGEALDELERDGLVGAS